MRVRLLGGLEIEGLDERALGSRKARTVLRRLAAALGRPVSYDELAAAAWGDARCGSGRALVTLARAYPEGRYVGYDAVPANVERARGLAAEAGVDDRVRFEVSDVAAGLPGSFDVVFTFDVLHDAADPLALLRAIRQALRPGGRYVCLDINASDRVEDNVRPLGTIFYGFSVLYCMTSSLAVGGAGLGTCGSNEVIATALGRRAGISAFLPRPPRQPLQPPLRGRAVTGSVGDLLARATSRIEVRPGDARTGSVFSRVVIDDQRYFLKTQ